MYSKGLGVVNTATGITLLPNTGGHRLLFIIAASLLTSGIVIFAISFALGRKARNSEAN